MEEKRAFINQVRNGFHVEIRSNEGMGGSYDKIFLTKPEMLAELVEFFDEKNTEEEVPF
jgi:hypothetical protein